MRFVAFKMQSLVRKRTFENECFTSLHGGWFDVTRHNEVHIWNHLRHGLFYVGIIRIARTTMVLPFAWPNITDVVVLGIETMRSIVAV